eukprot:CAMPEP_0119320516 /NCGR_PEP_ID=MMETSP1333-20130426/52692_1 /TAXON_ID=418940 /ORGANISM="Scyphosphaera apsteinii, Strain RCC1455" /LENGTH=221 /DNA_ID=CAMNT_0007327255 /DNA_START=105 /DNA_END=767 /DNA_ORIENTATION=-
MASTVQPPLNFGLVCPGVYRSGFPSRHNLTFLQQLGLRTLIRLAEGEYPAELVKWVAHEGIEVLECVMTCNQEPFVGMEESILLRALRAVLHTATRPLLVHCLRGQQLTGVLVSCVRKLQRWSLASTFDEYRRYAGPTSSLRDLQLIELIDLHELSAKRDDANRVCQEDQTGGQRVEAEMGEQATRQNLSQSTTLKRVMMPENRHLHNDGQLSKETELLEW